MPRIETQTENFSNSSKVFSKRKLIPVIFGKLLPRRWCVGKADEIVPHASQAGQNLSEGCHNKVLPMPEQN